MIRVLFLCMLMLTACGSEETATTEKVSSSQKETKEHNSVAHKEIKTVQESPKDVGDFCDCVLKKSPELCLETFSSTYSREDLMAQDCYQEYQYTAEAIKLCNCLNSIRQVSLDCDELQRSIDERFDSTEQKRIAHYFKQLDCIPEK